MDSADAAAAVAALAARGMVGWSDQSTGLALAISSSAFIGASFIIKKKGLKRAGASGLRAGARGGGGAASVWEPPHLTHTRFPPPPPPQTHTPSPAALQARAATRTCASRYGGRACWLWSRGRQPTLQLMHSHLPCWSRRLAR